MRARPAVAFLVAAALALGACALEDEAVDAPGMDGSGFEASDARGDLGDVEQAVADVVADLNDYWSVADADLGFDYVPVRLDRVSDGTDGVVCDGAGFDPGDLEGNAFVDAECAEGITVAYDPAYVDDSLPRLEATLAHEWGHVIQAQAEEVDLSLDPDGLPIDAELQADCFAGAWAAERARSDLDDLRDEAADAGDEGDVDIEDPDAHGTPQDRVAAFEVGLEHGPVGCVEDLIDALP